ncbi:flagellar hook-basal body complex protein FliE [Desulfurispora thermophila]|uniref:flagellar hook-basal body complex protein FliE n=1 Tax=Desulfurispora thermophila TaxID=265470 RepID=UPI000370985A|nr:flagellar hook-basal body complex protein FliE [Desulfurispora thermophila]
MQIMPVPQLLPVSALDAAPQSTGNEVEKKGFAVWLAEALERVNEAQKVADQTVLNFLTGQVQDVHQVTITMEQAKLMLQLAVEVRNKLVESYQEISRMPV